MRRSPAGRLVPHRAWGALFLLATIAHCQPAAPLLCTDGNVTQAPSGGTLEVPVKSVYTCAWSLGRAGTTVQVAFTGATADLFHVALPT